jgi:hypothetical protein
MIFRVVSDLVFKADLYCSHLSVVDSSRYPRQCSAISRNLASLRLCWEAVRLDPLFLLAHDGRAWPAVRPGNEFHKNTEENKPAGTVSLISHRTVKSIYIWHWIWRKQYKCSNLVKELKSPMAYFPLYFSEIPL